MRFRGPSGQFPGRARPRAHFAGAGARAPRTGTRLRAYDITDEAASPCESVRSGREPQPGAWNTARAGGRPPLRPGFPLARGSQARGVALRPSPSHASRKAPGVRARPAGGGRPARGAMAARWVRRVRPWPVSAHGGRRPRRAEGRRGRTGRGRPRKLGRGDFPEA